jgi:uncharacterized membrane protein
LVTARVALGQRQYEPNDKIQGRDNPGRSLGDAGFYCRSEDCPQAQPLRANSSVPFTARIRWFPNIGAAAKVMLCSDGMSNTATPKHLRLKNFLRALVAVFFVVAGAMHFVRPGFYFTIMPPYLPWPMELIYVSGLFEILGGAGLIPGVTRRFSGIGLMLLLLAVLPANIQMLVQNLREHSFSIFTVLLILRLPLQFIFIAIVNRVSKSS